MPTGSGAVTRAVPHHLAAFLSSINHRESLAVTCAAGLPPGYRPS